MEQISHYRILKQLGAGGMDEVYLGEDMKLGRKVAIKVLSEEYTTSKDRLKRFEQEACSASALNHPNILTIYEVGDDNGRHFIATEYIDGITLRQKLAENTKSCRLNWCDRRRSTAVAVCDIFPTTHSMLKASRTYRTDRAYLTTHSRRIYRNVRTFEVA